MSSCAATSSSRAERASSNKVRPGANSGCWRTRATLAPACKRTSPPSGWSRPASSRSRVVLPMPLGPTRPTRWPAYNSKPISSNKGIWSNPRVRWEQLNSSMVLIVHVMILKREPEAQAKDSLACASGFQVALLFCGQGARTSGAEEPIDEGWVRAQRSGLAKQGDGPIPLSGKPHLMGQEAEQVGIFRLHGQHAFQAVQMVGEVLVVLVKVAARLKFRPGPIAIQLP